MGRKGVSKRKAKQPNTKSSSGGSVSSVVKAAENQPIRLQDSDKSTSSSKFSSDRKKNSKNR